MVHDPVIYNTSTRGAGRIEITAKNEPIFQVKDTMLAEAVELHNEILKRAAEFGYVHEAIVAARDIWPDIPSQKLTP